MPEHRPSVRPRPRVGEELQRAAKRLSPPREKPPAQALTFTNNTRTGRNVLVG